MERSLDFHVKPVIEVDTGSLGREVEETGTLGRGVEETGTLDYEVEPVHEEDAIDRVQLNL